MAFRFESGQFYTEHELIVRGDFTSSQLRRAREDGLRYKEYSRGQRLYLGEWLTEWLSKPEVRGEEDQNAQGRRQAVRPRQDR